MKSSACAFHRAPLIFSAPSADMLHSRTDTTVHLAPIVRPESGQESDPTAVLDIEALQPRIVQPERWMLGGMVGRSLVMQQFLHRVRCTAPHFRLVNVEGEQGSGKLLTAQTLHRLGPAASGPFVPSIAAEFIQDPQPLWQEARAGLLYLSRIDELSTDQQRLLRDYLERAAHERMRPTRGSAPQQIVAGSTQSLRRLAAAGTFRADLASHLTAIRFAIPPLRDRKEDIALLAGLFLRTWSGQHNSQLRGFAAGVLPRLISYEWPGNVRELESVIAASALESSGHWIRPIDIPRLHWPVASASVPETAEPVAEDPNLDRAILRHVSRILARVNGNKVRAARMLGISRSTLYRLLDASHPAASGDLSS